MPGPKLSLKEAQYTKSPTPPFSCSNCRHFHSPSSCDFVQGRVHRTGGCDYWVVKGPGGEADTIPTKLKPSEYILTDAMVKSLGPGKLERLRKKTHANDM